MQIFAKSLHVLVILLIKLISATAGADYGIRFTAITDYPDVFVHQLYLRERNEGKLYARPYTHYIMENKPFTNVGVAKPFFQNMVDNVVPKTY